MKIYPQGYLLDIRNNAPGLYKGENSVAIGIKQLGNITVSMHLTFVFDYVGKVNKIKHFSPYVL